MSVVTGNRTLNADQDLLGLLAFMEANIQTSKLIAVADSLPQMARLLWSQYPQEPCFPLSIVAPGPVAADLSLQDATV